ncbi:MAG TPA: hypothetical protein VFR58_05955 [Flavisolibacter sp.]|nr:hypothetical protein [Flavisolibacter sp.]
MKAFYTLLAISVVFASCKTLNSTTTIKPNDSFLLGNNVHGSFRASLKNLSNGPVEVCQKPVDGDMVTLQTVAPNERVSVSVPRNTALVVVNKTADTANVRLKVKGDTGLSMQYRQ